jgi:hypothetical protein
LQEDIASGNGENPKDAHIFAPTNLCAVEIVHREHGAALILICKKAKPFALSSFL